MPPSANKLTLVVLGLVVLATLATISSLTLGANNLAGLRGVEIKPFGDFWIDPGESLLMSAEGDYLTYTIPLRGAWRITDGKELGYLLERCDSDKTCEFQAGDEGGEVTVYVEANGNTDEKVIHIRKPAKPKKAVNPFKDPLPDWAGEPIVSLKDRNIIRGYDNGNYGASDLLTRGQLITIFHRTLVSMNLIATQNCQQVYKDVPGDHYAFAAACIFRNFGWTDSLSTLEPNEPVTRAETASIINRVVGAALLKARNLNLGSVITDGSVYSDVPRSHRNFGDIAVNRAVGIMRGNPDKTFGPNRTLNRAEAATIFFRMMNITEEEGIRSL